MENNRPDAAAEFTSEVVPFIGSLSTQSIALVSFVAAVFLFLVLTLMRRRSTSRGNSLLLVGPPDSGKTAIFSTLSYNQTLPSHMSLQTNSTVVALSGSKILRVVDVPGHPRIRDQFRDHLGVAKAIVFVVDASTISRNGHAVAEHLHQVLHAITSLPPSHPTPPLVILAHKTDLLKTSASTSSAADIAISRVRTILERELEKRRASQASGVGIESLGAEGEITEMGGLDCVGPAGVAFKFSEWEGGEVDFAATWVKVGEKDEEGKGEGEDGLASLKNWLGELSN
ncbi:signal recognition particle receptor beta subunit-domain-containing protein [Scleroderma yunnanense]